MTATNLSALVESFLEGELAQRTARFVLLTSAEVRARATLARLSHERERLLRHGVQFEVWDIDELSSRLRRHPVLVLSYFGPHWRDMFCGTVVESVALRWIPPTTSSPKGAACLSLGDLISFELSHSWLMHNLPHPQRPPLSPLGPPLPEGVSFEVPEREGARFCAALEEVGPRFFQQIRYLDELWEVDGLRYDAKNYSFELVSMPAEVWRALKALIGQLDFEGGSSKWHIFDANPAQVRVVRLPRPTHPVFHTVIDAQPAENVLIGQTESQDWCSVQWPLVGNLAEEYGADAVWSAANARRWFLEQLLPFLWERLRTEPAIWTKRGWSKERLAKLRAMEGDGLNDCLDKLPVVSNPSDLLCLVDRLQYFFHTFGQRSPAMRLPADAVQVALRVLDDVLSQAADDCRGYIAGKLLFRRSRPRTRPPTEGLRRTPPSIEELRKHVRDMISGNVPAHSPEHMPEHITVDLILRCVSVSLRGEAHLELAEMLAISRRLDPLQEAYRFAKLVERHLERR